MEKEKKWEEKGENKWIDEKKDLFVIKRGEVGGMGEKEEVKLYEREDDERFKEDNGGRIVRLDEMKRD